MGDPGFGGDRPVGQVTQSASGDDADGGVEKGLAAGAVFRAGFRRRRSCFLSCHIVQPNPQNYPLDKPIRLDNSIGEARIEGER